MQSNQLSAGAIFCKFVLISIDQFSSIFFWFLFCLVGGWFVFFKLQASVYCMIPTDVA